MIQIINNLFDNLFNSHYLVLNFGDYNILNVDLGILLSSLFVIYLIVSISMLVLRLIK